MRKVHPLQPRDPPLFSELPPFDHGELFNPTKSDRCLAKNNRLLRHPFLIAGSSRFNLIRAAAIVNCQSTPRCWALVLSAQIPISLGHFARAPIRRSLEHWRVGQLSSHAATFRQLPRFGVRHNSIRFPKVRATPGGNAASKAQRPDLMQSHAGSDRWTAPGGPPHPRILS